MIDYTATSRIRRKVKTKFTHLKNRLHDELSHSLNDLSSIDRDNISLHLKKLVKKNASGSTTSLDSLDEHDDPNITITRVLATTFDVSHQSVKNVFKRETLRSYKLQLVHELNEDDFDIRVEFCEDMMAITIMTARNNIFSDEAIDELAVSGQVRTLIATSDSEDNNSEKQTSTKFKVCLDDHDDHTLMERVGQKLRETRDDVHRYFQRNSRLQDVNKRLKSQIWSSVVTIVLVEGKNLLACDPETGTSDPYVKFRLGNEKYKSRVIWRSLNPRWLEQLDLHLYDDGDQQLEITVWDKDRSRDDFMGRCVINLSELDREKTYGLWQELEDGAGSLHLLLTISGTTASETISDLTTYEDNPREKQTLFDRYGPESAPQRRVGTIQLYEN
ncbi:hypothetical protein NQ318_003949 [Aromia moschata]|uniref:C2 domain-containing protein n=1 Tax=Aromia moschata TaxID=1265417 RepID=A0AAV8Z7V4_9CUCU|nr:hypothetical protein NQ318_003949 [Aromia moschata]